jgi:hypothetical protein
MHHLGTQTLRSKKSNGSDQPVPALSCIHISYSQDISSLRMGLRREEIQIDPVCDNVDVARPKHHTSGALRLPLRVEAVVDLA